MNRITVVSLGPGSRQALTLGAVDALKSAGKVILRTRLRCDAADYLQEIGVQFDTLDPLHEDSEDFDELIARSARAVLDAAEKTDVCYAVFDASADETVTALRASGADIGVLPGVALSAPFLSAAPANSKIEIQTASSLDVTGIQNPLLILECNSRMLMGECKLQLLKWYDPDRTVYFFPPSDDLRRTYAPIPLADVDRQKQYDHTCAVFLPTEPLIRHKRFDFYDLVRVMAILRGENGCPWDREQTHATLRKYLIEEAHEAAAAIDEEDWDHVADELGDVLLQIVFHARVGEDTGTFDLTDITTCICRKMIDRHRHIFGGDHCDTAQQVADHWEDIKKQERGYRTQGDVLKGVSKGLPALMRAAKVQKKASDVGFACADPRQALDQVAEEAEAVRREIGKDGKALEMKLGDLLFACVQVGNLLGLDGDTALEKAVENFISRFCYMENAILRDGKCLKGLTLSEMDVYLKGSKQGQRL